MKDYIVTIDDLRTELKKDLLPSDKGVYFVFSARKNADAKYSIIRLLYIGRSSDVNKRINGKHHKHADISRECTNDVGIPVYYYGEVSPNTDDDVIRVEAALIFHNQPVLNQTADKNFNHQDTHILLQRNENSCNGKILPSAFGDKEFIVKKTSI